MWSWEENLNLKTVNSCASVRISTAERDFCLQTGLSTRWNVTLKTLILNMFVFSPLKIFLDSWGSQMDFLGSIYWNSFTAVSLRNAVVFFLRKEEVWFDGLKEIWHEPGARFTSWNKRLMCSQKYVELFHCAPAFAEIMHWNLGYFSFSGLGILLFAMVCRIKGLGMWETS